MPGAPINQAFSVISAIGFFVVLIPLPWYLEHWNVGTVLFMFWTATALFIKFIDSIIWGGNALDSVPIWCEITTRIFIAASIGVPTASLCIMYRMYIIASVKEIMTSRSRRRAVFIDLSIGLGIPIIFIPLYFVIQGNRYNLYEDYGCVPAISMTPMTIPLYGMWPLIIGIVSGTFGSLAIREFLKRRSEFKDNLSSHANLTSNRYFRHMALAAADIAITIPFTAHYLYEVSTNLFYAWNYDWVHTDWDAVYTYPAVLWRSQTQSYVNVELSRWIFVLGAFVFFVFFGLGKEARRQYGLMATSASRAFHRSVDIEQNDIREQFAFGPAISTPCSTPGLRTKSQDRSSRGTLIVEIGEVNRGDGNEGIDIVDV